jgi:hypothetical protein
MKNVTTMAFEGNTKSFISLKCNEFLRTFSHGGSESNFYTKWELTSLFYSTSLLLLWMQHYMIHCLKVLF